MKRIIYIKNDVLSLVEYMKEDDLDSYKNWLDPETQSGFNGNFYDTFEDYTQREIKQRFYSSIRINDSNAIIGSIGVSPENGLPDLAIWIYKPYRNKGYGKIAFLLGVNYCFDILKLDKIYAGCYPHNIASMKMLSKCGFVSNPSGNQDEKHFLTGEPITQFDYVLYNSKNKAVY